MYNKSKGRRGLMLCAASSVALCLSTAAFAQNATPAPAADDQAGEVVIIRGFRASLQNSLRAKKNSNLIIESITAEDIGKFPDQNIAESLQRLAGIQIDRENGQGTKVRIRGLDQNVTVLNNEIFVTGLEFFRLGEGKSVNTDSLEGIPSELIGGVDVYKSPDASLLEGGLGGIINLKTRNARSFKGDSLFSMDLRLNKGTDTNFKPTVSVVGGYKFSPNFAVLGTVSYDKNDISTSFLGGENRGGWSATSPTSGPAGTVSVYSPEYRYSGIRDQERERLGYSLNADWKISDSLNLRADWFHTDLSILTSEASLKFAFANEGATLASSGLSINNNILQSGTVTAGSAEAISYVQNAESVTDNVQLQLAWDNGGALTGVFRASASKSDYDSSSANNDVRYTQYGVRNGTTAGLIPNATAPASFTFGYVNGEMPTFKPSRANATALTNTSAIFFKSHWGFEENTEVNNASLSADFKYKPKFGQENNLLFSFGARVASREVDSKFGLYLADLSGKGELPTSARGTTVNGTFINWSPHGYFQDGAIGLKTCDINLSTCNRFGNSIAVVTPYQTGASNPERLERVDINGIDIMVANRALMTDAKSWLQALYPSTPIGLYNDPLQSFKIKEETTSGYLMVEGQKDERYYLNLGVRVVNTKLTTNASSTPVTPLYWGTDSWNGVVSNPDKSNVTRDYTDILPSANFTFTVNDTDKLRASAARVVSRQSLFSLGQGNSYNFTRSSTAGPNLNKFLFTNGSGGNPKLDPYRASQFDVSYERYIGTKGLFSAGIFYKSVDSFIQNNTISVCVSDQSVAGCTNGSFNAPVNGDGGTISGVELSSQYSFENGFGFNANYTLSDSSSSNFNDFGKDLPIPGVSKNAYNIQGFYEKNGYEARVSYAWRDTSYEGNFGFGTSNLGVWKNAYGQLDAQVGYSVNEKLKVTLEAINLTEEANSAYLQFEDLPFRYISGDRRIVVGLRYKY